MLHDQLPTPLLVQGLLRGKPVLQQVLQLLTPRFMFMGKLPPHEQCCRSDGAGHLQLLRC